MRITDLPTLTTGSFDDYLYIIDVSDTGSFLSGSSKKIKLGNLLLTPITGGGGGGGSKLHTGSYYPITSSWSNWSNFASYALTASYALNGGGGGGGSTTLTNVTRSGDGTNTVFNLGNPTFSSINSLVFLGGISMTVNADYTLTSGVLTFTNPPLNNEEIHVIRLNGGGGGGSGSISLNTGSTYPITSSWSRRSLTASYALNGGGTTTLHTGSKYPITSSWANKAITASYALNGSGGTTTLHTGSKYPITSSWASRVLTASYATNYGSSITQSFTAKSIWNFTHNLGEKQVIIQAYNSSDNQIIPQSILLLNSNSARLTFPFSASGYAVATRGGIRVLSSSYGYYNLHTGSMYPITSSWSIKALTASVATRLLNSDSVSQSFNNLSTWTFNHNLDTKPILVQAYNNSFNQILPANITLSTNNTAVLTFPFSASGYAIATRSGLRSISSTNNFATTGSNNFKNTQTISNGFLILTKVSSSLNFANDTAAGLGGVPLGGIYRNGNIIQIRLT